MILHVICSLVEPMHQIHLHVYEQSFTLHPYKLKKKTQKKTQKERFMYTFSPTLIGFNFLNSIFTINILLLNLKFICVN